MRSFRYIFDGEEELEALLIEMWIRVEEIDAATPEIEIRRHDGAQGTLLIRVDVDPHLERGPQVEMLALKCRYRSLPWRGAPAGYDGCRSADRQQHAAVGRTGARRQRRQSQCMLTT